VRDRSTAGTRTNDHDVMNFRSTFNLWHEFVRILPQNCASQ
jgi:hypothetical protein